MAQIIGCSIDVTKIDKTKLVEGKNGAKYFNFNVNVEDEPNEYGKDCSITLSQTKEQRDAKEKKVYIGSGKTLWRSTKTHQTVKQQTNDSSDPLPF